MVVVNRMRGVARHLGHVLDGERHGEPFMLYMRIPSKPVCLEIHGIALECTLMLIIKFDSQPV